MEDAARTPNFGRSLSASQRFAQIPEHAGSRGHGGHECQDNQCAEDGCDPEECGNEDHAPTREPDIPLLCGFDKRPLLPLGLTSSTVASASCVMLVQIPLLEELQGDRMWPVVFFVPLFVVIFATMAYTALSDPGQHFQAPQDGHDRGAPPQLPRRSHKSWLYTFPIRRYDHYCRWLMNVIGLFNHRSFVVMCGGLMASVLCGGLVDVALMFHTAYRSLWRDCWILFFHLAYCVAVVGLLGPIMWLHVGFISRNELAHEWNKNWNYVAWSDKAGAMLPVNDLSDDEFNEQFDDFEYVPSRNAWDHGIVSNCLNFWFHSRDKLDELGEF